MMKKCILIALSLVMALSLTACGTHKAEATEEVTFDDVTDAEAEAEEGGYDLDNVGEYTWALGTDSVEDTVTHLFALRFSYLVSAYSDGKMNVNVYSNGKIGGDTALIETVGANDGGAAFVIQTTAPQVTMMEKLAVFDIPCAYRTIEEFREAIDQEDFQELLNEVYEEAGYHILGMADQGFRLMTSNVEITSIEDFSGIKIRTMSNSNHIAFWQAIGANPSPLAWSETFTALQTNAIDAQENPYEVIAGSKLYEVQDYVVETNHVAHALSLVTSSGLYESLNEDEQAILDRAAAEAVEYARNQADERAADRIQICVDGGMEILEISDETYEDILEACSDLYDDLHEVIGDDLYYSYLAFSDVE